MKISEPRDGTHKTVDGIGSFAIDIFIFSSQYATIVKMYIQNQSGIKSSSLVVNQSNIVKF